MTPDEDGPTIDSAEEGFAGRWARRKRAALDVDPNTETSPPAALDDAIDDSPEAEARRAANLAEAEAVDIDAIDRDTNMRIFERDGVPDWLRRKAFQTLWRSNPVFANLDGLNDYDEDFARPDLVMKTFRSAYEAGRGYLAHIEAEAARNSKDDDESGEDVAAAADGKEDEGETSDPEAVRPPQLEPIAQTPELAPAITAASDGGSVEESETPPRVSLRHRLMLGGEREPRIRPADWRADMVSQRPERS